ncbi:XRE family transcriptional regulator [Rugamonas sp. DEMB1]|uniref:XRE family transcriptional regulator n=1 Tax=Rugamonas sp. DEMB1 TaxID=3039386 RepID=UPI0024476F9F|nr:XRE family transcriptional regulator [Rugamonas sp. DEMB1]WGG51414.1 XRE family transcriptional regulator [Rugamonas sp. DEMB1]
MKYDSVDLAALAERLVAARKAANLTQEAAANHLNLSRPTFIAIEKAVRRPKPEELVKLAGLYKEPLNRLLRNAPRPADGLRPHLRSILDPALGAEAPLESAIAALSAYIDDYQYLERLVAARRSTHFPPAVRMAAGPVERFAEHCAQEERARLNLGAHQAIYALRKVLEEAGLHVFIDKLDSTLAGLYMFVPDFGFCILVNRLHPRERRRWTIAHEYAHFLSDRGRPGVDYLQQTRRKPEGERFADAFAAALLMPEAGVQRRFYEALERSGDFKVGDLCHMADYFAVSPMAMTLRLESIGLIPRSRWDRISGSGLPLGELKQEAGGGLAHDDAVEAYPQRYKMLAVQAFVDDKITEGQLARLLRCTRIEAREIVERCSAGGDDGDGMAGMSPLLFTRSLLSNTTG